MTKRNDDPATSQDPTGFIDLGERTIAPQDGQVILSEEGFDHAMRGLEELMHISACFGDRTTLPRRGQAPRKLETVTIGDVHAIMGLIHHRLDKAETARLSLSL